MTGQKTGHHFTIQRTAGKVPALFEIALHHNDMMTITPLFGHAIRATRSVQHSPSAILPFSAALWPTEASPQILFSLAPLSDCFLYLTIPGASCQFIFPGPGVISSFHPTILF